MTNKQRQEQLDKIKFIDSSNAHSDLSGKMPYCDFCPKQTASPKTCLAPQTDREAMSLCAKAYNKFTKPKK